jgi:hypothetical protein
MRPGAHPNGYDWIGQDFRLVSMLKTDHVPVDGVNKRAF